MKTSTGCSWSIHRSTSTFRPIASRQPASFQLKVTTWSPRRKPFSDWSAFARSTAAVMAPAIDRPTDQRPVYGIITPRWNVRDETATTTTTRIATNFVQRTSVQAVDVDHIDRSKGTDRILFMLLRSPYYMWDVFTKIKSAIYQPIGQVIWIRNGSLSICSTNLIQLFY